MVLGYTVCVINTQVSVCELLPADRRQQQIEQVVVYDQGSWSVPSGDDSFIVVLLAKLARAFPGSVALLTGEWVTVIWTSN